VRKGTWKEEWARDEKMKEGKMGSCGAGGGWSEWGDLEYLIGV
jgi:hypothetical protein